MSPYGSDMSKQKIVYERYKIESKKNERNVKTFTSFLFISIIVVDDVDLPEGQ